MYALAAADALLYTVTSQRALGHDPLQVVSSKMATGVGPSGLTLAGFIFLHALFIERGRLESTWKVMTQFGAPARALLLLWAVL